jgi:hypothetical protein
MSLSKRLDEAVRESGITKNAADILNDLPEERKKL